MSVDRNPGRAAYATFGNHRGLFDGERVIITVHGVVSETDAVQIMEFILRWDNEIGNISMVLHAPTSFSVTPEARKYFVKSARTGRPPIPMAVMGTSMLVRGIVTLLVNAIRITLHRDVPLRFCATEAEARDWLREQQALRETLLAVNPAKTPTAPKS